MKVEGGGGAIPRLAPTLSLQPLFIFDVLAKPCFFFLLVFFRKKPHAHKNKIGTSTPASKKPQHPPPKRRNLMGMEVFLQKEPKMPGAHKIGAAISGPRITGGDFMDITFFFSDFSLRRLPYFFCVFPLFFPSILRVQRRNRPLLVSGFSKMQGLEGQGRMGECPRIPSKNGLFSGVEKVTRSSINIKRFFKQGPFCF